MIELMPYLFYVFLAVALSRSCAVIAARRVGQKRPGEKLLASMDILPDRGTSSARDAVAACYAVLNESGVSSWTACFALLHVVSWGMFGGMILVMGIVGLARQF